MATALSNGERRRMPSGSSARSMTHIHTNPRKSVILLTIPHLHSTHSRPCRPHNSIPGFPPPSHTLPETGPRLSSPSPHSAQNNGRQALFPGFCGNGHRQAVRHQYGCNLPHGERNPHGPTALYRMAGREYAYITRYSFRILLSTVFPAILRIEIKGELLQASPVVLKIQVDGLSPVRTFRSVVQAEPLFPQQITVIGFQYRTIFHLKTALPLRLEGQYQGSRFKCKLSGRLGYCSRAEI